MTIGLIIALIQTNAQLRWQCKNLCDKLKIQQQQSKLQNNDLEVWRQSLQLLRNQHTTKLNRIEAIITTKVKEIEENVATNESISVNDFGKTLSKLKRMVISSKPFSFSSCCFALNIFQWFYASSFSSIPSKIVRYLLNPDLYLPSSSVCFSSNRYRAFNGCHSDGVR